MTRPTLVVAIRYIVLAVALWFCGAPLWLAVSPLALMIPVLAAASCGSCTSPFKNQYQIVISGLSLSTDCDCSVYNGTWTVTKSSTIPTFTGSDSCYAEYQINPCLCYSTSTADTIAGGKFSTNRLVFYVETIAASSGLAVVAFVRNSSGTDCTVLVNNSNGFFAAWSYDTSVGSRDCSNFSSVSFGMFTFPQCGGTAGNTALVTAL